MKDNLIHQNSVPLADATLLLALSGWMDGGDVSTGTVRTLMQGRDLSAVARIEPAGFYIENFPGSMELAAVFRPNVKYDHGVIESFEETSNAFLADPKANLAFFLGREPNIGWSIFADHIFEVARLMGVVRIVFVGSFGGSVPHTREPRLYGSVSTPKLRTLLKQHRLRPSEYEGPASFATYLLYRAPKEKLEMINIAAEIPGYLQGINPLSIEAVTRRLARLLNVPVDLDALRESSNAWEAQVSEAVEKDADLANTVRELEEQYDNELIEQNE